MLITLALVAAVTIMSVVPGRYRPGDTIFVRLISVTPAGMHKLLHVLAYALLAFMCMWTFAETGRTWMRALLVFTLTVGMGAGLEWRQRSVIARYGTVKDAALNAVGSAVGLLAAVYLL